MSNLKSAINQACAVTILAEFILLITQIWVESPITSHFIDNLLRTNELIFFATLVFYWLLFIDLNNKDKKQL